MTHRKKICVVGGGDWGKNHIKTLDRLGSLGAIVEPDCNKLDTLKNEHSNISFFSGIKEAIRFGFDGFIVATPAKTHYDIARQIIESKHHVLIEKPITDNLKDANHLVKLAKDNNVNLMVGHLLLFHPAFIKIKEMIEEGAIGDLQYLYSNRLNLGTVRDHENVFWSFAPHDISLFQFLVGAMPINIYSQGNDVLQKGIHDTTVTSLEYSNKIMGHIFVSWLHPFKEHRFVVIGSKGMLHFEDSCDEKPLKFYEKKIEFNGNIPVLRGNPSQLVDYEFKMPLEEELKYFINHLDGTPLSVANGKSAIEVISILEEATSKLIERN